jgi:branched-subunit amino acid transport protein
MSNAIWLGITVIAVLTFLIRFAPLGFDKVRNSNYARQTAWLDALGPCLLASMALVILFPAAKEAIATETLLPFIGGVSATVIMMLIRRDGGLAVMAGVFTWWIIRVAGQ